MVAPKLIATAVMMAANMALTMTRRIEGPRLDDTTFTAGDYGASLPMIWGTRRMEVPIFWAENLREVKQRGKTKGGKFNDYTYYATFAVALAGHEIEGVSRIWFDTHLVLDLTGAGPITPFEFNAPSRGGKTTLPFTGLVPGLIIGNVGVVEAGGFALGDSFALYRGTSTQEPDPRMQATVEAEFGEGSCPAYRDTAYIVFKDIPLEKLGNRIPQVSVEILGAKADNYPTDQLVDGRGDNWRYTFSKDFSVLLYSADSFYQLIDTASRTVIAGHSASLQASTHIGGALLESGEMIAAKVGGGTVASFTPEGTSTDIFTASAALRGTWVFLDEDGNEHYYLSSGSVTGVIVADGVELDVGTISGVDDCFADSFVQDGDKRVWAVCTNAARTQGYLVGLDTVATLPFTLTGTGGSYLNAAYYTDGTIEHFVVGKDDYLYFVPLDPDIAPTSLAATGYSVADERDPWINLPPESSTIWLGFYEVSLLDGSVVRSEDPDSWGIPGPATRPTVYDPVNHALIDGGRNWYYLDRVGPGDVLLSTIAGDVADMCGVETHDFSDLDQVVTGWSATRGQASNMLEPLLDAYDSDIRPHDFGIEGIKRTGVTTGSAIATAWLVGDPRYSITVRQELPRALLIDFADIDADQQPNTARADRPLDATDARGERKFDLTTLALDTDEAIQLANRHFRRIWNERQEVSTALTAKELILEPGDVRSITLDDTTRSYRCTSLIIKADDTLATEWRYDHPSLATLDGSAGAAFDGRNESVVIIPLLSKGFVLDIPLLSDADDASVPQVYPVAGPVAEGAWPGATIYQEVGGEYTEELATRTSSEAATWGLVSGAMPYANPNLWDRGTAITVTLQTGALTGCTEAAANADPSLNLAAIGANGRWEIVQFTVATLTAPLTYTVSGFKRGRRGTEWAAELHAAGDTFVLLETADATAMGLDEVGTDVSFKAITSGRTTGFAFGYEYQGQSLMPYAPVHLDAVKDPATGDWTFTWVRRTRVGGAWTSGSTIPLSELTEEYELTLGDGVTTVTKSPTTNSYVWDVATQTSDTGAEVMAVDLEWSVAQVSDAVGAGFLATA